MKFYMTMSSKMMLIFGIFKTSNRTKRQNVSHNSKSPNPIHPVWTQVDKSRQEQINRKNKQRMADKAEDVEMATFWSSWCKHLGEE
jgi:hypothetical protein